MQRLDCPVVIAGGGVGGVAAALAAVREGVRACLTEPTRWLGGQMTAQAVSALDENQWIEGAGAARSYQDLRRRIRSAYGGRPNPGACWVSRLCFEPAAGVRVLDDLLAPHVKSGLVRVMLRTVPVEARRERGTISVLRTYSFETRTFTDLRGRVFIDATELGDLLPMAGASFRTGAESRAETGEPDAPAVADPGAIQSFTYPFVLSRGDAGGIPFSKPAAYEQLSAQYSFRIDYGGGKVLEYGMYDHREGTPGPFWTYRRLIAAEGADLAMINWPGNDACNPGYISEDPLTAARAFQYGKQVALGFAWWLKHEAPNAGGRGFADLVLRGDVLGSADGLSLYPYIREARRMAALTTVREQDVAEPWQAGARARAYNDTAGIGFYPLDIHGCREPKPLPRAKPYQIPFGALISREIPNLLAGAKNLGVTHITNGAYREHPTEWAIGEAVGTLAAAAVRALRHPAEIYRDPQRLRAVQLRLLAAGHPLVWFDDVTPAHPAFAAIQEAALNGLMPPAEDSLHFRPDDMVTGEEAKGLPAPIRRADFARRLSGRTID